MPSRLFYRNALDRSISSIIQFIFINIISLLLLLL